MYFTTVFILVRGYTRSEGATVIITVVMYLCLSESELHLLRDIFTSYYFLKLFLLFI